jgi:hypothetical protein
MPDDFTESKRERKARKKPRRARGRHPATRAQKGRQRACWADLNNLFSEPYDEPFGKLRAQAEADLLDTVQAAATRLDKPIRDGFRVLDGGRT